MTQFHGEEKFSEKLQLQSLWPLMSCFRAGSTEGVKMRGKIKYIKPVSVEEAREKALPILVEGYRKRGEQRSEVDKLKRSALKLERDKWSDSEPKICAL